MFPKSYCYSSSWKALKKKLIQSYSEGSYPNVPPCMIVIKSISSIVNKSQKIKNKTKKLKKSFHNSFSILSFYFFQILCFFLNISRALIQYFQTVWVSLDRVRLPRAFRQAKTCIYLLMIQRLTVTLSLNETFYTLFLH